MGCWIQTLRIQPCNSCWTVKHRPKSTPITSSEKLLRYSVWFTTFPFLLCPHVMAEAQPSLNQLSVAMVPSAPANWYCVGKRSEEETRHIEVIASAVTTTLSCRALRRMHVTVTKVTKAPEGVGVLEVLSHCYLLCSGVGLGLHLSSRYWPQTNHNSLALIFLTKHFIQLTDKEQNWLFHPLLSSKFSLTDGLLVKI